MKKKKKILILVIMLSLLSLTAITTYSRYAKTVTKTGTIATADVGYCQIITNEKASWVIFISPLISTILTFPL